MDIDKRIIYPAIIALFSISAVLVFQAQTAGDADYALLLKGGMTLEAAKMANAALFILLPLAVYLVSAYLLKNDEFSSFGAAALFAAAGMNAQGLYSLSPLLALAFGKQYEIADALRGAGAILPLAAVAMIGFRKDGVAAALGALGLATLPFAPGISSILLAIAAAKGIGMMGAEKYGGIALVGVLFVFTFQASYSGDVPAALAVSALMAIIAYVVVSVHALTAKDVSAVVFLLFAFAALGMIYSASQAEAGALSQDEIAAFAAAKGMGGSFGVFDYPNAFAYYSGKNAALLNASALLRKDARLPGLAVVSTRALDRAYSEKPVFFTYRGIARQNTTEFAVFANAGYVLYMHSRAGELLVEDGQLYDARSGEGMTIPFTKIKRLYNSTPYSDPANRIVNLQQVEGSALQSLLFGPDSVFAQNSTRIVKVK